MNIDQSFEISTPGERPGNGPSHLDRGAFRVSSMRRFSLPSTRHHKNDDAFCRCHVWAWLLGSSSKRLLPAVNAQLGSPQAVTEREVTVSCLLKQSLAEHSNWFCTGSGSPPISSLPQEDLHGVASMVQTLPWTRIICYNHQCHQAKACRDLRRCADLIDGGSPHALLQSDQQQKCIMQTTSPSFQSICHCCLDFVCWDIGN